MPHAAIYIHPHTILQKDLVRRLRNLVHVLREDGGVDADSPEWPGLAATAHLLAQPAYLHHADGEIRLYAVLAGVEILTIVSRCAVSISSSL